LLCWQEFEEIAATALRNNNFTVTKNMRFKSSGRRWEIDVVGCKKPLVVCIDCKHYHHTITPSELKKIVDSQIDRAKAFADVLPNPKLTLDCIQWDTAKFVPAVLSLLPSSFKFVFDVPIVPVLQLQDFLTQLPAYANTLKFIPKSFEHLSHEP
jgi:Holliday junction resolvase-like predicted endonuclease